jgi:isoquinoline 1-oxidoreductase beta subunit
VDEYIDGWIPWGAYDNPYKFSAFEANYVHVESPVPTGAWRAVFYNQNVFARECFIDEIAHEIGRDPLALRLALLDAPDVELENYKIERKRLKNVLEVVMEKSDWQASLQKEDGKRWGKGVACNIYHERNFMAYVAEVLVDKENNISVQRIVCVVDCGQVINPSGLKGQIESGIAWGLSASLKGGITFKDGGVEQNSYKDFEVVRINEMPEVDIHLIENTTHPAGIGEPPVPMVAPAVANAVFAATGQRLRKVPLILAS